MANQRPADVPEGLIFLTNMREDKLHRHQSLKEFVHISSEAVDINGDKLDGYSSIWCKLFEKEEIMSIMLMQVNIEKLIQSLRLTS